MKVMVPVTMKMKFYLYRIMFYIRYKLKKDFCKRYTVIIFRMVRSAFYLLAVKDMSFSSFVSKLAFKRKTLFD
jgi:hypothetical protein